MPLLSEEMVRELLNQALAAARGHGVKDYCRTCDEFYWTDGPEKHYGHRLTLVPFVEERGR